MTSSCFRACRTLCLLPSSLLRKRRSRVAVLEMIKKICFTPLKPHATATITSFCHICWPSTHTRPCNLSFSILVLWHYIKVPHILFLHLGLSCEISNACYRVDHALCLLCLQPIPGLRHLKNI